MLLLNRKIGESIVIGDDIVITVLTVRRGNQVQLSINAPKHISVHREEIYNKIKNQEARESDVDINNTPKDNKNIH